MVLLSAIIGGVLGFAIGGPPGALAGGILGWLVGLQLAKPNPSPSHATPPCSAPRSLADRSKPGNGSEAPPISQRPQTPSRIQPSGDQKRALETILKAEWAREAVFVTGVAGTGKSTVLQLVKEETYKQCAIVAPTGIAALNVGGQTIHSFFSLKPTLIRPGNSEDIKVYYPNSRKRKVMESLDLLIVDEVSMVRADLLDAIDFSLRVNRNKRDQPFGGVQVALFGDPLQLEPVTTEDIRPYISDEWGGPFFFDAKTWGDAGCEVVYLRTPHRHKEDHEFYAILQALRHSDYSVMPALNERVLITSSPPSEALVLTPRRKYAEEVNRSKLDTLRGNPHVYEADISGAFRESDVPAERSLVLKPGARVMTLKNTDYFCNGALATVLSCKDGEIVIRLDSGEKVSVTPYTWEQIQYTYHEQTKTIEPKVVGTFRQFPLRLAWAITIHKCQGLTLDRVHIDFSSGMFAHGQIYVALTRCRRSSGLSLSRPLETNDFIWDSRVQRFMKKCEDEGCFGRSL